MRMRESSEKRLPSVVARPMSGKKDVEHATGVSWAPARESILVVNNFFFKFWNIIIYIYIYIYIYNILVAVYLYERKINLH